MMLWIRKRWVLVSIAVIVCIATFLRFYNLHNRWGLGYDQARDVLVARYALESFQLPLLGPFSSAGAFIYGPQWYWLLMFLEILSPDNVMSLWVMQGLLFVGAVLLMVLIGKEIQDIKLGLLMGLLTAVSPYQIQQSINLTTPSMIAVFSVACFYFFVMYIKYDKYIFAFLLGLFVSTTVNIHFQAVGLFSFLPIAFLFQKKDMKRMALLFGGAVIPFIPLIYFDITHHFYESRNVLYYYQYGQHIAYVPTRWLTYVGVFWPSFWGKVISGYASIGYIVLASFILLFIKKIKYKNLKVFIASILVFLCIFILLRYYKGQRFESYFVFTHIFIFTFTAWVLYQIITLQRLLGLLVTGTVIALAVYTATTEMLNAHNYTAEKIRRWEHVLYKTYPQEKFMVYDYQYKHTGSSLSLSFFLHVQDKIADNGVAIGIMNATSSAIPYKVLYTNEGVMLVDVSSSTAAQLHEAEWAPVNPSKVYHSIEEWPEDEKI